jgi:RHS repeat-associated protein
MAEETRANEQPFNNRPANGESEKRSRRPDRPLPSLQPLQAAPGITALAGEVRTLSDQSLEGVTLRVGEQTARTDETGRFLLISVPPGHHELLIDGRTASRAGQVYGVFEVGIDVRAGRTNVLPFTIWMPEIDTEHTVSISSPTTDEVVVTTPHIPGWELHLPPGTIIRDKDGQIVTQISITPIPVDRPPFPLPFGAEFPMYFTVQPGGAYIEPYGARIIYPNITKEPPGTRINFWNYDPEEKGWHIYGRGTVTRDGGQVVPDEGVSVYELAGASAGPSPKGQPQGSGSGGAVPSDGDPVDLATRLFVVEKTDLFLPDVLPIALTRTHRPANSIQGLKPFGVGSEHIYEIGLFFDTQFQEADLVLAGGSRVHYSRISPGTGSANALFEHTATPSVFFGSKLQKGLDRWELPRKDGTVYEFSDSGVPLLVSVRDRNQNRITILRKQVEHGKAIQVLSPNGRWLRLTLDDADRVVEATDNIGRIVTYTYNTQANLLSTVTDAAGGVTEYRYDSVHGNSIGTIKDARGIVFFTNAYNEMGRIIKQTQADGSTYEFEFTVDVNGNTTQSLVTDPRGNIRRVTFNADGYILTDTRALGTPEEQTTIYERETGTNLVLSITDPLGRKTSNTYDAMGNVTSITRLADTSEAVTTRFTYEPKFNQPTTVTDPSGHTIACAYDENGNLTILTDALGNSMTLAYNSQGQIVSITDALGNVAQVTYDFGISSGTINPLGATATRRIDSAGRVVTVTDPVGQATIHAYDAHNHLTQVTDPLGGVAAFSYDPNGNLLSVTDARGSVTNYTYDAMDRLVSRTDPLGRSENYQYDAGGNLTRFTDRRRQATTFTYDALNRLTQVAHADGSITTYTYDAGNRLTQVVDSVSGTITLTYDNLDRLTAEATPQGTVSYTYDVVGHRTSMTVPGQPPVTYAYDDAHRLTKITEGASAVIIAYDTAGRRVSLSLPGDVIVEYGYDAASQLTNITYRRTGAVLGDLIYEYDAAGNRVRVGGSFARTTIPEAVSVLTYDAANQLTQQGTSSLSYDANGNLTSDGTRNYVWDARNQLASINGTGVTAGFQYDAFGRRARKTVNGTTTEFLYDRLNVVQEASGGTPIANLLTGLGVDEYFVRTTANGPQMLLADALGSTVGLLNANGVLQTEYAYEPFGATTATGTANTNPFQYTGRENDATGLYNYRARYYSPTLRRFISEDPLGFAGGDSNLYTYALSSPTSFTDPLGLSVDLLDCAEVIQEAWERGKQMKTSGRKGEEVERAKEAGEEALRTMLKTILCLLPVEVGMIFPMLPKPPLPPPPNEWPNRRPKKNLPESWLREREKWEKEHAGKDVENAISKHSRPGWFRRVWRRLFGRR